MFQIFTTSARNLGCFSSISRFYGLIVNVQPNMGALPGGSTLQTLTDGIAGWALMIALIALLVGAASWAIGAHSQNYHQSSVGKRTVMVSAGAALLIGAAPVLINFFFSMGQNIH